MGKGFNCIERRREYNSKTVGRNLKRLRIKNRLTVEYVREYLGLESVQAVYKHESGKCYPQADTLLALMELYGATVSDIVDERNHLKIYFDYFERFYNAAS